MSESVSGQKRAFFLCAKITAHDPSCSQSDRRMQASTPEPNAEMITLIQTSSPTFLYDILGLWPQSLHSNFSSSPSLSVCVCVCACVHSHSRIPRERARVKRSMDRDKLDRMSAMEYGEHVHRSLAGMHEVCGQDARSVWSGCTR